LIGRQEEQSARQVRCSKTAKKGLPMESTSPFRDPLPGALARRRELLSSRRDDFVEMPEDIRRTYVARWGRVGGGAAAALVASVFLALIVLQQIAPALGLWLYGLAEELLPGKRPAVLATLAVGAWLAGGFAWILARAWAERAFARRTTEAALPSDDVDRDIDRLAHVTPALVGRKHALQIEGASAALPLLALGLLLPAAAVYLALAVSVGGYPKEAAFESSLLAGATGLAALAAVGLCLALTLRAGLRRWPASRLRPAAGAVAAIGVAAGLTAAVVGGVVVGAGLVGLMGAGAVALLIVRRERFALGLADSSAAALDDSIGGSLGVVIGIVHAHAGRLARAVTSSRAAGALRRMAAGARSSRRRSVLVAAAGFAAVGFAAGVVAFSLQAPAADRVAWTAEDPGGIDVLSVGVAQDLPDLPEAATPGASLVASPGGEDGELVMTFRFDGHPAEARLRSLFIPATGAVGWRVSIEAHLLGSPGQATPVIGLSPFRDTAVEYGSAWRFSSDCMRRPSIEWRAAAREDATSGPASVRIAWSATLESCKLDI
jgi:hypothetical protein